MPYRVHDLYNLIGSTEPGYFAGFEIREPNSDHDGGIWIQEIPQNSRPLLSLRELKTWCDPYPYQLREPIITFPCTDEQLAFFLHVTGADHFLVDNGSGLFKHIKRIRDDIKDKIGATPKEINTHGMTIEKKIQAQRIRIKMDERYMAKLRQYVVNVDTDSPECKRAEASAALKSLHTADIDKQIENVIQVIDAAIRKQLYAKGKNLIVNHIRFLKDAGIGSRKRAKEKVKAHIAKEYSSFGYSVMSRRPSQKDEYFVTS